MANMLLLQRHDDYMKDQEAINVAMADLREAGFWDIEWFVASGEHEDYVLDVRWGLTGLANCDAVALMPGWRDSDALLYISSIARHLGCDVRLVSGFTG